MLDLDFRIDGAAAVPYAIAPTLAFKLRVSSVPDADEATTPAIQGVSLNCQIRLEPARRRYSPTEQRRLLELFGEPHRWGQTVRPMLWTHVTTNIRPFDGSTSADLPVPCTFDFNVATTKYFHALEDGTIPLSFLFSGTIFYADENGALRVTQISWEKEATFPLTVATWRTMMDLYYPNTAWLYLRSDAFDRLAEFKVRHGLSTWEGAIEALLDQAEEAATP